jgi:hypothetical protein
MKIDLPITIIFDCQEASHSAIGRAAGHIVGTLRYETDGDGSDAVLFGQYPPNEKPFTVAGSPYTPQGEPAQVLLSFISRDADKRITARAERSPYDYLHAGVTDAEREIIQEEVDEQRRQDGQFGAGA